MKVKEIMKTPVISATAQAPVSEVAGLLKRHQISAVPVVDDAGAVVGVVSDYDLIAKKGSVASDVMSAGVISVTEETDVDDVRGLLVDRRIRRVPVLSGRALVGIVSRSDIIALMVMEWVCDVCGEPVHSGRPPEKCPRCGAASDHFAEQQQPPGD